MNYKKLQDLKKAFQEYKNYTDNLAIRKGHEFFEALDKEYNEIKKSQKKEAIPDK